MNAQDLKKHHWKDRIIIVKATNIDSEKQQKQLQQFDGFSEEMIDRKFVIYIVTGDDFILINFKKPTLNTSGKVSGKLAKILNNTEHFEFLLIGLDGGIKLRQTEIITKKELFKLVDSMPMRSSELRNRN